MAVIGAECGAAAIVLIIAPSSAPKGQIFGSKKRLRVNLENSDSGSALISTKFSIFFCSVDSSQTVKASKHD